tara:strand:+ start:967 stop:1101 length:135 start_codon:yes stop_codon:yes gene_type:complete
MKFKQLTKEFYVLDMVWANLEDALLLTTSLLLYPQQTLNYESAN